MELVAKVIMKVVVVRLELRVACSERAVWVAGVRRVGSCLGLGRAVWREPGLEGMALGS